MKEKKNIHCFSLQASGHVQFIQFCDRCGGHTSLFLALHITFASEARVHTHRQVYLLTIMH